jgi:uncharacterized protein (TIGR03437 family)
VSKRLIASLAAFLLLAAPLSSQILVDTFAGGAVGSGVSAQDVALANVAGLAWDVAGNLVFCDQSANVIRHIRPDGVIETISGNGTNSFSGDGGPAVDAILNFPANSRFDAGGNLYFVDSQNSRIRRIDNQGIITTVAGDGVPFVTGMDLQGPALQRSLGGVTDLAVDPAGNVYFTEESNDVVRRVTPAGQIEIFAGVAHPDCINCSDGDGGPALAAKLNRPSLLAQGGSGSLYIAEGPVPTSIRRIGPDGIISTFVPNLYQIRSMAADNAGNVYVIWFPPLNPHSPQFTTILRIDASGSITTVAGGQDGENISPDGPAVPSSIKPLGLAVDAHGNVAFADNDGTLVRVVTTQSMLQTLAGANPKPAPDGTPALAAWFINPVAIAFNAAGDLYIAEAGPCLIRKIGADGRLATAAGTGKCGFAVAGTPSTTQDLAPPAGIAVDSQNRLFMVDATGNTYVISPDGRVAPALYPLPLGPRFHIAIDFEDRVYVSGPFSMFRVSPDGKQETIVGMPAQPGPLPPGSGPTTLGATGVDPSHNVYFTGTYSASPTDSVFRVNDDGTFSPVYGSPSNPLHLGIPNALAVDARVNVWLGTTMVNTSGLAVLGFPSGGYSGDGGPAQSARFNTSAAAFSPGGDLYLLDNNRIRKLSGSEPPLTPAIALGGIVNAASYTGGGVSPGELLSIFGSNFGVYGMGFGTTVLKVNAPENNRIPSVLVRTKVLFNGLPGAITALTPSQINVFAPSSLPPGTSVNVVVQVDATPSAPVSVPVVAAVPSLAAADERGSGQGAVLNQDASLNSASNPAARGSIVSLFGTGEGAISPALPSGYLTISTPFSVPTLPVTVTIGGQQAEVIYAGEAPFEPAGVFQINARIPAAIAPGNAPISVSIGGIATSKQVTVAVR